MKFVSAYGLHLWQKLSQNRLKFIPDVLRGPFSDILALVETNSRFGYPVGLTHKPNHPLSVFCRRTWRCSRDNACFKLLVRGGTGFNNFIKKMDDCIKGERAEFAVEMDYWSGCSTHDGAIRIWASWGVYSRCRVFALAMKVGFENGILHVVVTTLAVFISEGAEEGCRLGRLWPKNLGIDFTVLEEKNSSARDTTKE